MKLSSSVLGLLNESSEMFVRDQESVGQRQVGGWTGAPTLTEPVGDGLSLIGETILRERERERERERGGGGGRRGKEKRWRERS